MEHQLTPQSRQKEQAKKPVSSSPLQTNAAGPVTLHPMLRLQRTVGNQAVQRLVNSGRLQTKLTVNQPGDVYEQEADRVADQITRAPDSSPTQHTCACGGIADSSGECEACATKLNAIQRKATHPESVATAPSLVTDVLNSSGRPLDNATRSFMEPHFEQDFSNVRVHTDGRAAESAQAVNARAYTVGSDIVFGAEQYQPGMSEGQKLLAHELTHVVQQGAVDKNGGSKSVASAPNGIVQRQLITPLGQGGGFQGLMERDRQAATNPPAPENVVSIPEAIEGGWRKVRDLKEGVLQTASVAQRLTMLTELIQAYWTGGAEEEAIIRILRSTPLPQSAELVKQLSEQTINGKSYLEELDRVVDFGNNLELHNVLSQLRLKAMGPEKGTKALETAPILPWHDVMGFFEDAATFSVSQASGGKVNVKYPVHVLASTDFADEVKKLPTDIFIGGYNYEPDQVLVIHDYDKGRFVPVVAQELIGYQHAGIRGFLGHVATVVSLAIPVGAAETAAARAAIFVLDRLLPIVFTLIDENRLNIVKWFPNWGPKMLYYSDLAQLGVGVFGIGRFAVTGWKILKSWRDISKTRAALEGAKSLDADAERLAATLEKQAEEIFAEAEKIHTSEGTAAQEAGQLEKDVQGQKQLEKAGPSEKLPQKEEPALHQPEVAELSPGTRRAIDDIEHAICGFCFPAGTKVLTRDGYKKIEDIEVGDFVLARDEHLTGDVAYKRIVKTFRNISDSLIEITVGNQMIKSTPGHVWWTLEKGWTFAQNLEVGDLVITSNDDVLPITGVRYLNEMTITFNCEVEEYHTYFVAANDEEPGIWVHNASALRVLRPNQVFQLIIPNIIISNPEAIRGVIGRSLNATGTYSTELKGFFAYLRRGGGAGFQGVTKDAIDRLEIVLQNISEKGGGVVAAIDLEEIGAQRIFDLNNPKLAQELLDSYPRFHKFFTKLAGEGVVAVRGKIPARAVQSLVNIPENLSEVEKESILKALLKSCR